MNESSAGFYFVCIWITTEHRLLCAPRICLSFPSLICLFKELCVRRLLSAGENEYITAHIFCQHFLNFFSIFFSFFFRVLSPARDAVPGQGTHTVLKRPAARTAGGARDHTTAKAGSPAPGEGAAPLWSRGPWPVPACGHRGLPSGATAAARGFAP